MHLAQGCSHCWKHFWNSCCGIFSRAVTFLMSSVPWTLHPFKADFIFGNSQKSRRVKSGEWGGCPISVIEFSARNCMTESTPCYLEHCHDGKPSRWAKVEALFFYVRLHVTASVFPHNNLG